MLADMSAGVGGEKGLCAKTPGWVANVPVLKHAWATTAGRIIFVFQLASAPSCLVWVSRR